MPEEEAPEPQVGEEPAVDAPQTLSTDPEVMRAELDRARNEAAKYRKKAKDLEPFAQRAQELEDAQKTETQRLTEQLTAAEQRAQDAELRVLRTDVARDKGLTSAQAKYLTGTTSEELEASADQILEDFRPPEIDEPGRPKRRPSELVPGAVPGVESEPDYDAIADRVRRW